MKSVVFCGSIRYAEQMAEWVKQLESRGIKAYAPRQSQPYNWGGLTDAERRQFWLQFIDKHNQAINGHDAMFVFNPEGKVGNSVTLEIGYTLAKGKPIYAMNPDNEIGRDVLYSGYCKSIEELLKVL